MTAPVVMVGKIPAVDQSSGEAVRSPVQTDAAPAAEPMATQVVEVQERPVIEVAPVGKVDSGDQALTPPAETAVVRMVGSNVWSNR